MSGRVEAPVFEITSRREAKVPGQFWEGTQMPLLREAQLYFPGMIVDRQDGEIVSFPVQSKRQLNLEDANLD